MADSKEDIKISESFNDKLDWNVAQQFLGVAALWNGIGFVLQNSYDSTENGFSIFFCMFTNAQYLAAAALCCAARLGLRVLITLANKAKSYP